MGAHSYTRCWLHIVWATIERRRLLLEPVAQKVRDYLIRYATEKALGLKAAYVNSDHVHVLLDLPASKAIEDVVQLLKGSSSHWINENGLVAGKFGWQRGYGAFSVSQSGVDDVSAYIENQAKHHQMKSFADEFRQFVEKYGLQWQENENR